MLSLADYTAGGESRPALKWFYLYSNDIIYPFAEIVNKSHLENGLVEIFSDRTDHGAIQPFDFQRQSGEEYFRMHDG